MRSRVSHPVTILILLSGLPLDAVGMQQREPTASASAPAVAEHRVDVPALTVGTTTLESTLQISGNPPCRRRVSRYWRSCRARCRGSPFRSAIAVRAGQTGRGDGPPGDRCAGRCRRRGVNVAHAALESAEASLANAVVEHERSERLFEAGAIPRQRLDETQTGRRAATAQRDLAKANVAQGRSGAAPRARNAA
jgi:hypothetical protein